MSPEERDIIGRFVARVGGAPAQAGFSGSVPATTQRPLPPVDPEADSFIRQQFQVYPEAPYRVTQMAFVQEAALAEAQNRIRQLEYQLQQAQAQAAQAAQNAGGGRGFFGGLFGGGRQAGPQYAPPPQYAQPPQMSYPPGYQPGMFQRGGSGFLGSALTTAAGVAGGVLAADAISSLFSGGHGYGGGFGGGWGGGMGGGVYNETVVNNYGSAADPWAGAGTTDPGAGGGDPWSGGGSDAGGDWSGGGDAGGGDWGGDGGGFSDDAI